MRHRRRTRRLVPVTRTESPTAGMVMATVPVKTKIPDDAAGREPSALGCWIQKPGLPPIVRTAVTIPGTRSTVAPLSSERKPLPWMSWMDFGPGWQAGSAGLAAQSTGGVTDNRGSLRRRCPHREVAGVVPRVGERVDRCAGPTWCSLKRRRRASRRRSRWRRRSRRSRRPRRTASQSAAASQVRLVAHERHLASRRAHGDRADDVRGRQRRRWPWPRQPLGRGRTTSPGWTR